MLEEIMHINIAVSYTHLSNTIGDVASGYMIGNVTLDQTNIEVTGPKSAISQVDHAGVDINVTDSTTSLSANVDIKLYDADDNELVLESVKKNVDSAYMTVEAVSYTHLDVYKRQIIII